MAGGTLVDAYTEALRLYFIDERVDQASEFNSSTAALTDQQVAGKSALLRATYEQLRDDPSSFLHEITVGYIRLLEEIQLAELDPDHGGDRQRTWREEPQLQETQARAGNLMVFPWPRGHSLGGWQKPDFGFEVINATASGIDPDTLKRLKYSELHDLDLTLGFRFRVDDAHIQWKWDGVLGTSDVWFTRTSAGEFFVEDTDDGLGKEWLASYYTNSDREFSASERDANARLGARKLYEATKHMQIGKLDEDY